MRSVFVKSPPPKPEVILTNFFAEPTVLLMPITSRVLPISLYCCEIWGLESALKCKESDPYELLHTKFMKEILGVHCKTPNAACRSELARQPCRRKIITACIKYLDHVISSKDTLSHDILKATWKSNVWIRNIISCINRLGFPI